MTTGLRHIATEPANLSNKYFNMDKKRSPLPRNKIKSVSGAAASDSEGSLESNNSLSAESNNGHLSKPPPKDSAANK